MPKPTKSKGRMRPAANPASPFAKAGTKQAWIVDLLQRAKGASLEEIVLATAWQAHSVRAVLSGLRKRKLGLTRLSDAKGFSRYFLKPEA